MTESIGVAELRNAEHQIAFCESRLRVWKETLEQLRETLGMDPAPGQGSSRLTGRAAAVSSYAARAASLPQRQRDSAS